MTRTIWQKIRSAKGLACETAGAEIAEAAVVLPLLLLLLFGILWFARAFNIYTTINRAARQGALVAATNNCGTCGNDNCPDQVYIQTNVVNPILTASHLDPAQATVTLNPIDPQLYPGSTFLLIAKWRSTTL